MSKEPAKPAPRPRALAANALDRADLARPNLHAKVANDVLPEDVLRPAFWINHIPTLAKFPFAEITVVREDGSMILKLMCMEAKPGLAMMHVLYRYVSNENLPHIEDGVVKLELPDGYKVVNIAQGENKGWQVKIGVNGDVIASKLSTRNQAVMFAIQHASASATLPVQAARALETTT